MPPVPVRFAEGGEAQRIEAEILFVRMSGQKDWSGKPGFLRLRRKKCAQKTRMLTIQNCTPLPGGILTRFLFWGINFVIPGVFTGILESPGIVRMLYVRNN
jgi:hypothetical protein